METRQIGSLNVSAIGLGYKNFGRSLDAGISFFDTADIYGRWNAEYRIS